jgi:hypothetical protein
MLWVRTTKGLPPRGLTIASATQLLASVTPRQLAFMTQCFASQTQTAYVRKAKHWPAPGQAFTKPTQNHSVVNVLQRGRQGQALALPT